MDKDRRKELKEQYNNRHPQMGIVCWQCGEEIWALASKDTNKDYNGTSFQLNLGSWPNRELQKKYTENPEKFKWFIAKELEYEDYSEDHTDELEILMLEFLEENPDAKPMKPMKKFKKPTD